MGREERFPSTGFLPAYACWLCYFLVGVGFSVCFAFSPSDAWQTGFMASMLTTVLVFCFAFVFKNTSIYDPYWCWFPLFSAIGWMSTAESGPSARSCYTLGLLMAWFLRYNSQWPWEGWTHGIRTEDWRYPMMARKLGLRDSVGLLYWLGVSLVGSHLIPTLLVWFVLAPVQKVWTSGLSVAPLGSLDLLAVTTSLGGVALQFLSDRTLYNFRKANIKANEGELEKKVCGKTCREGPWAYSRHPNYLGEVLFWLGMDLAAVAGGWTSWISAFGGIANYACFFRVSASLMDARSLRNRPGYVEVMKETSALLPCPLIVDQVLDRLLIPQS
mmetsp:Transcript_84494/g.149549  ORF Transcript_84494/g.149549 Transcript_84494/m.149549 type:complete len:329 (-) Transcript_84494:223-1209(-)